MHLIGNMLFLWVFADNIEATIGNGRFLFFYIFGGLAAHAAHIYFNMDSMVPTVGASGAISAVMGAYLVMFPTSRIKMLFIVFTFRIPALLFLLFWIWQQWLNGAAALNVQTAESVGVAWWAHIGGFVFGVVAGIYYRTKYNGGNKQREATYV
jgi:membrane associated rhomboid family serine protease